MFYLVNLTTVAIVSSFQGTPGQMRVEIPDGTNRIIMGAGPGDVASPFKIFARTLSESGSGSVISDSAPVYDAQAGTVTVTRTLSNPLPPSKIPFDDFLDRLTAQERSAARKYMGRVDILTGEPLRPAMLEGFDRLRGRGMVDLTSPLLSTFLQELVDATPQILTPARKTTILTP